MNRLVFTIRLTCRQPSTCNWPLREIAVYYVFYHHILYSRVHRHDPSRQIDSNKYSLVRNMLVPVSRPPIPSVPIDEAVDRLGDIAGEGAIAAVELCDFLFAVSLPTELLVVASLKCSVGQRLAIVDDDLRVEGADEVGFNADRPKLFITIFRVLH